MSVIRIAFLGTPEFASYHLQSLLRDSHYQVVGVVSQPDRPSGRHMHLTASPVKKLAEENGVKVITPDSMKSQEAIDEVASWKAEAAVVVAYGQILPQKFLDLFPGRVVNVHGSLLPRWRGAAPIQRAIMAGDKVTGVSLQVMVKKLDAGDVLGCYKLPIDEKINALELHDKLMPLGAKLLEIELMDYLRGNLTPTPQEESLVTYAHKIEKSESQIVWNRSAIEIANHIRGMVMGPGTYSILNDKKLKIHRAQVADLENQRDSLKDGAASGEIIEVHPDSFVVKCQTGALQIIEVQPESRPRMSVRDFLLGHPLTVGVRFL